MSVRGVLVSLLVSALAGSFWMGNNDIGQFEGSSDIGTMLVPGKVSYDKAKDSYAVTAAGENMWFASDAFHYVWKKVEGDVGLTASINFPNPGKNPHRKACLVIRQSLDADSVYADIAIHGDGLTSLQYRDGKGDTTHEAQSNVTGPKRVRVERRGRYVTAFVANADGKLEPSGGSVNLPLNGAFYIGLGVCSHEKDFAETAVFSEVEIAPLAHSPKLRLHSTLETVTISSTDRRTVRVFDEHIEAPNWLPDGKDLIYNSKGSLYRIPATGGVPVKINTDFANRCNNDHGVSPDGKTVVISDQSQDDGQSVIYTLPIEGGKPRRITSGSPSYWHGWSPDGKTLAYCARRDNKYGIFTIPVGGGEETRLTTTDGLDDGPDYSPDGKYIYFNSDRTGRMQIHRMHTDGSAMEQVTHSDRNEWFAHISPNGRWMVYLSYGPEVEGHPADKDVELRLLNLAEGKTSTLAKLFGGQGTINVPSWSPDSTKLSFVSYQYLP